jgi:hypothetical protein
MLAAPLVSWLGVRGALVVVGCFLPVLVALLGGRLIRVDAAAAAPERTRLELLRSIPMFAVLPGQTLEGLASRLAPLEFEAGTELMRQGDLADRFYVIASGEVAVTVDGQPVTTLFPGDYVGEIALLRGVPRAATVLARSSVGAFALERGDFLGAVTGYAPSMEAAETIATARLSALRGPRMRGVPGI